MVTYSLKHKTQVKRVIFFFPAVMTTVLNKTVKCKFLLKNDWENLSFNLSLPLILSIQWVPEIHLNLQMQKLDICDMKHISLGASHEWTHMLIYFHTSHSFRLHLSAQKDVEEDVEGRCIVLWIKVYQLHATSPYWLAVQYLQTWNDTHSPTSSYPGIQPQKFFITALLSAALYFYTIATI